MRPALQPYEPNLQPYMCPSGADISFLSAFPTEKEVLYPPLTFLRATGQTQKIEIGDGSVTIMEVIPSM